MGAARLLAKAWVAFCLFAGAHALSHALATGTPPAQAIGSVAICVGLFGAMGLMFVAGYGAAFRGLSLLKPAYFTPGFNEIIFILFAVAVFTVQIAYREGQDPQGILGALESAIRFVVPGQRALGDVLSAAPTVVTPAGPGAGAISNVLFASATSWLLAFIFLGSSLSRLRISAALLRFERKARTSALTPASQTAVLGILAMIGCQLLFVGSAFAWIPPSVLTGLPGSVLIGLGPLALAYLITAALTNLWSLSPEA
ncbi:MAG TPA: hypothetical protein VGG48_04665 [Rhizomicrobium sp.]|jgi:predicted membrane protein